MGQVTSHDENDCLSQEITNILQADDKDTEVTSSSNLKMTGANMKATAESRAVLTQVKSLPDWYEWVY